MAKTETPKTDPAPPAPKSRRGPRVISVSAAEELTPKERHDFTHSHPGNTIVEDATFEEMQRPAEAASPAK